MSGINRSAPSDQPFWPKHQPEKKKFVSTGSECINYTPVSDDKLISKSFNLQACLKKQNCTTANCDENHFTV